MNQKPYFNLEAAAGILDCTPQDIIYLGAQGVIPIYVLPKGWRADYYTYIDDETNDNFPESEPNNPDKLWSNVKDYSQTELLVPVRLHQYTLAVLLAEPNTTTKYFFSPSYRDRNAFNELRVHSDAEGNSLDNVALKECVLVIMNVDIKKYLHSQPKTTSEVTNNTAQIGDTLHKTLLKQIAIIATLLSSKAGKYKNGEKINADAIATDVEALLDEFKDEFNEQTLKIHGLSKPNIRKNIGLGVKLLYKA